MAYIGKTPTSGDFVLLDSITTSATASYTMQKNSVNFTPQSANHMIVSLNGTIQAPVSSFTVSGSTLTFSEALTSSDVIDFVLVLGNVNDVGVATSVVDSAITKNKLDLISTSGSPGLTVKGDGSSENGTIQLNCSQNSHGVKISSPDHSHSQSYELILPTGNVTADTFLKVASVSGSGTTGIGQLSFGTVTSGLFTKITSVNGSASTTENIIDNCFGSSYRNYFVTCEKISISNSSSNCEFRLRTGGSSGAYAGGNLGGANHGFGAGGLGELSNVKVNSTTFNLTANTYADDDFAFHFYIFNPYATNERTIVSGRAVYREGSTSYVGFNDFGFLSISTENHTGFAINSSSAQFNAGARITVYGITDPS